MRTLYSLAWYLLAPAIAVRLLLLAIRDPAWRRGLGERLGRIKTRAPRGIWVHAASVGEIQATLPLINALRLKYPDLPLTLTSFTPSGREHALRMLPEDICCALLPFDFPGAVRRFLERVKPRIAIVVETELWPNLYAACRRAEVPVVIVSARVTESSARAYGRMRRLTAATLSIPEVISAQTEVDAQRIQALGADPTRVTIGGNIKFDFRLPEGIHQRTAALRADLQLGARPVWIAASTHDGEDGPVLAAHRALLTAHPDALLVLAPRHPGRADAVAGLIEAAGFRSGRRSSKASAGAGVQVYLLDTLGELAVFYGLADVTFIGGTLVPVGGHNLLEPAAFGLPLLCGPHVDSVRRIHGLLAEGGAVRGVVDADSLAAELVGLFGDDDARRRVGAAGRRVLEQNRGAVERALHLVAGILR
ncbi:MAG: lipid IV(A) 3-deoxy-D-manno-octulosonic acid transferase [Xanthomonadaceae bacterium]|nr:lipid IV(A) 3-deoxy-D-manno-octulosonic acid transferase [Xanthomonadaceae bacterium]